MLTKARVYRWLVLAFSSLSLPMSVLRVRMLIAHPTVVGMGLTALAVGVEISALVWALRSSDAQITGKRSLLYLVASLSLAVFITMFVDYPVMAAAQRAHEIAHAGDGQPSNMKRAIQQEEDFSIPTDPYALLLQKANSRSDFAAVLVGAVNPRLPDSMRRVRCAALIQRADDTGAAQYPAFYAGTVLPVLAWCEDALGHAATAANGYVTVARFRNDAAADRNVILLDATNDASGDDAANAFMALAHRLSPAERTREIAVVCRTRYRRIGADLARACRRYAGIRGSRTVARLSADSPRPR